jgi:hypothetical protein
MEDMPIEDEWLSQILGEGTRKHYTRSITYFKEFLKTSSAEDLINFRKRERNFETRIIQYFQWLQKERGITSNSARAYVIGLQSFFNYAGCPVKLKNKVAQVTYEDRILETHFGRSTETVQVWRYVCESLVVIVKRYSGKNG